MANLSTYYPAPITAADLGLSSSDNVTFGSIQNTPIGNTTPAAGTFTTLAATSSVGVPNGAKNDLSVRFANDTDTGFYLRAANTLCFVNGGNNRFDITSSQFRFAVGTVFGWTFNDLSGSLDLQLHRDEADTLALHRGSNPQALRLYNTFTDASNYERGFMRWNSNVLQIGTEKAGTGSARPFQIFTDGTARMTVLTSGFVGIGISNPQRLLDIYGTDSNARLRVRRDISGTARGMEVAVDAAGAGILAGDIAFATYVGTSKIFTCTSGLDVEFEQSRNLGFSTGTGTKIGTSTSQKFAFWNATPVAQPAAIADATDAATTQARLNDLLATMRTLGLIAT